MEVSDAELLELAADGDQDAWRGLTARYSGRLWAIARFCGLDREAADDVVQTCWLRLLDHLPLRDPNAVGGWLRTVAKNEAKRVATLQRRDVQPDNDSVFEKKTTADTPDQRVVADDDRVRLRRAFIKLDERCRRYLRYFFSSQPLSYREMSVELDRPVASLGPTRQRCLARLRTLFLAEGGTIGDPGGS